MSSATAIGIDFGATSIKSGVVRDGVIIEKGNVIQTRQDGNTAKLINAIIAEVERLREQYQEVEGVGFGLPGIINPAEGFILNLTNVKGWHNIPLRSIVSDRTDLTTNLENDAKSMAYGEWKF